MKSDLFSKIETRGPVKNNDTLKMVKHAWIVTNTKKNCIINALKFLHPMDLSIKNGANTKTKKMIKSFCGIFVDPT